MADSMKVAVRGPDGAAVSVLSHEGVVYRIEAQSSGPVVLAVAHQAEKRRREAMRRLGAFAPEEPKDMTKDMIRAYVDGLRHRSVL